MANTNINLIGLDFDTLKSNLKTWFKNRTQFKDIDFEGSNMNELIELLAYNTYLNGFYTNMIGAEMYLDSAQLRDSIVSRAKELNYTPRSFNSAQATIQVNVTPNSPVVSVVMPEGTTFTSKVGSNTFTFSTEQSKILSSNGTVFSANVDIFEGALVKESFVVNYANTQQRFVLSNPTIDIKTIDITVYEDAGTTPLTYTATDVLFDVTNLSQVFFVQAAENQQYEVVFGDGVFGRRPKDGATVVVNYLASSGELPNGASVFTPDGTIDGQSNIAIITSLNAAGGAVNESIESIRFTAPRYYQTQGRAITASDYEVLLRAQFPEIQAISVYGGEDHVPVTYGKVFISVAIVGVDSAPQVNKDRYAAFLKNRTPLGIDSLFVDPDFMSIEVTSNVTYNMNATTKLSNDIQTLVAAAVSTYNNTFLKDFKTTMRGSQLIAAIDNADLSIISNETSFKVIRELIPTTGSLVSISFSYGIPLRLFQGIHTQTNAITYGETLISTAFTYKGNRSVFVDHVDPDQTTGTIWIGSFQNNLINIVTSVGTINYLTGEINIGNVTIDAFEGNSLRFFARPLNTDISSTRSTILSINDTDVIVKVQGKAQ